MFFGSFLDGFGRFGVGTTYLGAPAQSRTTTRHIARLVKPCAIGCLKPSLGMLLVFFGEF